MKRHPTPLYTLSKHGLIETTNCRNGISFQIWAVQCRLGAYPCQLTPGSLAHKAYGKDLIHERHRHRYEFNMEFRERLEKSG